MNKNIINCSIDVAENDDNGNPTGKTAIIQFGGLATFEANNSLEGYAFRLIEKNKYGVKRISVSGKTFPVKSVNYWVGSITFNTYILDSVTATALFNYIYKSDKWVITEGDSEILEIIKTDGVLLDGDFIKIWNENNK